MRAGLLAGTLLLPAGSFAFIPRVPFQVLPELKQHRGADVRTVPEGARRIPAGSEQEDQAPTCS